MSTAYASQMIVDGWCFGSDNLFHYSASNLPLSEWYPGRTFCMRDEMVSRCERPPSFWQKDRVCSSCVRELIAMGEQLPEWQRRCA